MPILNLYVDDLTLKTLERVSAQTGRTVDDLAEAAISEAASAARRDWPLEEEARG